MSSFALKLDAALDGLHEGHWRPLRGYPNSMVKGGVKKHSPLIDPSDRKKRSTIGRMSKGVWSESKLNNQSQERLERFRESLAFKDRVDYINRVLGRSLWRYLLNWGVLAKIAKGEWTRENGMQLLKQFVDSGWRIPATLFWFGIIPPIPGKIWSYLFSALSIHGFIEPDSKLHKNLKRYLYPSTIEQAEEEVEREMEQEATTGKQDTNIHHLYRLSGNVPKSI